MRIPNLRPNLGFGNFVANAVLYLLITVFVAAVLFRDVVIQFQIGAWETTIPVILYNALIAFLAYKVQHRLSAAYGGRRVADLIVSMPMLLIVITAVAVWMGVPLIKDAPSTVASWLGTQISEAPTDYKTGTAILFGLVALWDVLIRDAFGVGRRSSQGLAAGMHWPPASSRPDGLPDETVELPSGTGKAEVKTPLKVKVVPEFWMDMPDGSEVQIHPTSRAMARVLRLTAPTTPTGGGTTPHVGTGT